MNSGQLYRIFEPLNKDMQLMRFSLYERDDHGDRNLFALPPNHQGLRNSYTIMNLDAIKIMEWTGTCDDNEDNTKEIYEDDILEVLYNDEKIICKVCKEACGFLLVSNSFPDGFIWLTNLLENDHDFFWIKDSKVIGNIHQNIELLRG